jgi:hypothetical protein
MLTVIEFKFPPHVGMRLIFLGRKYLFGPLANCVLPLVWKETFKKTDLNDDESRERHDQHRPLYTGPAEHDSPLRIWRNPSINPKTFPYYVRAVIPVAYLPDKRRYRTSEPG